MVIEFVHSDNNVIDSCSLSPRSAKQIPSESLQSIPSVGLGFLAFHITFLERSLTPVFPYFGYLDNLALSQMCLLFWQKYPSPQIKSQFLHRVSQIALGRILNGPHLFSDKPCVFPMSFFFHFCSQAPIPLFRPAVSIQICKIFFYQQLRQTFTFVLQIMWVVFFVSPEVTIPFN